MARFADPADAVQAALERAAAAAFEAFRPALAPAGDPERLRRELTTTPRIPAIVVAFVAILLTVTSLIFEPEAIRAISVFFSLFLVLFGLMNLLLAYEPGGAAPCLPGAVSTAARRSAVAAVNLNHHWLGGVPGSRRSASI
jgi:hypothetical protein